MSDNSESNEIVNEFLVESYEGLDQLDLDLVDLEQCGGNAELIGREVPGIGWLKSYPAVGTVE